MENEKIAKRAVKISIISLFVFLVFGLILLSIAITQTQAISQMNQKIKVLEQKIRVLENHKS